MDQRSTKPGLRAFSERNHPSIIGYVRGVPVWSMAGGSDDDSDPTPPADDPGDDDDDTDDDADDDDDDDSDDDDPKSKKGKSSKDKSKKDDDSDDDETVPAYKLERAERRMRAADKRASDLLKDNNDLKAQLKDGKNVPEAVRKEIDELRPKAERLEKDNKQLALQIAFLTTDVGINWADPEAAMKLADLSDVLDDDGKVDKRALKASLKDLAKRKPYLVAKKGESQDDSGDTDDGKDQGSNGRQSGSTMNGRRKGQRDTASREALAKRFPVLGRS